jgi:hypothetical protein
MIKIICTMVLLAFTSIQVIASAQQQPSIEYGSHSDLKGVKSIFIDTGANIELRNRIAKEITKNLKDIVIAGTPNEAQVYLWFQTDFLTRYAGTTVNGTVTDTNNTTNVQSQSTPQYRKVITGEGGVAIVKPNNVIRIIMNFSGTKGDKPPLATVFERDPSTNFARAFVKAYKEANKEEKK